MADLRSKVIRLAHSKPELRPHLLPLLAPSQSKQADLALSPADKKVISAFLDHKKGDSKKLTSNGTTLDGNWMGGNGIAKWDGDQIEMNDLGSRAAQTVQNYIKKTAPARWLKSAKTAAKDSSLDPKKAMMYFDIAFEEYNLDDAADEGDEVAEKLKAGDEALARKLEGDAVKAAEKLFGVKVSNEGHDAQGNLVCKFSVDSWADVDKAYKTIMRSYGGGDDTIDLAPFHVAQGFVLFPQGVNGPRYGNPAGRKDGDLDDWLDDNKD